MSLSKIATDVKWHRKTANDKIYTPKPFALKMIELCEITPDMKVLDPSKGGGVFYDNLPPCEKDYCEIDEGKDFFDYNKRVDLVIGNPPYSLWTKWLEHTTKITDKFCYIFGFLNLTPYRIEQLEKKGFFITKSAMCRVDYWFGVSFVAVFEKNKTPIIQSWGRVYCDICGKNCGRGGSGKSPNLCYAIQK